MEFRRAVREWLKDLSNMPDFKQAGGAVAKQKAEAFINNLTRDIMLSGKKFFVELTESCDNYVELQKKLMKSLWMKPAMELVKKRHAEKLKSANEEWKAMEIPEGRKGDAFKKVRFLQPGSSVVAKDVRLTPCLNGMKGTVLEVDHTKGRVTIQFPLPVGPVSLRRDNVEFS